MPVALPFILEGLACKTKFSVCTSIMGVPSHYSIKICSFCVGKNDLALSNVGNKFCPQQKTSRYAPKLISMLCKMHENDYPEVLER